MNDKIKMGLILVLGLIFLTFGFKYTFSWAHDHDLYSWIAKDIIVNHHWRLTGQITSVDGVFIGPLYYYLIAIVYAIFKMNPLSAIVVTTFVGLASILSIYFVIKEFWGKRAAELGAFLMATSTGIALYQRWSVPTQPAILWSIWFIYVLLKSIQGDKRILWIYGLLLGLVYHVHIALLPILPLPIIAYLLSGDSIIKLLSKIKFKEYFIFVLIFFIFSSPFWMFEVKHNWSQVKSTVAAMKIENKGPTGIRKINKVINASAKEVQRDLLQGYESLKVEYLWIVFFAMSFVLIKKKVIYGKQFGFFMAWILLILLAQFSSKKIVSEYYFTNFIPIFFIIFVLFVNKFLTNKYFMSLFLLVYLGLNYTWLIKQFSDNQSYFIKEQVVDYIVSDAKIKNYPCISINYIAKFGDGVGFRYLFWYKNMPLVKTNDNIPQYDIVIPFEQSLNSLDTKFGRVGIIKNKKNLIVDPKLCDDEKLILDPLLGYTE